MSGKYKDEIVQLSLGSAANAVTAHSLNLQGLACTTSTTNGYYNSSNSNKDVEALCDPYVTHDCSNNNNNNNGGLWVPRVLFFDEADQFTLQSTKNAFQLDFHHPPPPPKPSPKNDKINNNNPPKNDSTMTTSSSQHNNNNAIVMESFDRYITHQNDTRLSSSSSWGGTMEVLTSHTHNNNNNNNNGDTDQMRLLEDAFQRFQSSACAMSSSSYSRYYNPNYNNNNNYTQNNNSSYNSNNDRHMNWDDLEEEEEEEDDEELRRTKERMERQQWQQQEQQLNHQFSSAWNDITTYTSHNNNNNNNNIDNLNNKMSNIELKNDNNHNNHNNDNSHNKRKEKKDLPWRCYWMPPHPKYYAVEIPSNNTSSSSSLSSWYQEDSSSYWREEVVSEKIRKLLEQCNLVSGFQITLDHTTTNTYSSFYSGLTISILQELHQECKSSSIFSTILHNNNDQNNNDNIQQNSHNNAYWRSENKVVQSFRSSLHKGLTYHGLVEHSDLILPLSLDQSYHAMHNRISTYNNYKKNKNDTNDYTTPTVFESSAGLALALEASTLPFRISNQNNNTKKKSHIGIQSGFFQGSSQSHDDDDALFAHANQLSFHEYMACLRCPSNRHVMIDMSASFHQPTTTTTTSNENNNNNFFSKLSMGTSIERRRLEQERENFNRNRYYSNNNSNSSYNNHYRRTRSRDVDPGLWMEDTTTSPDGLLTTLSPTPSPPPSSSSSKNHANFHQLDRSLHRHFAIATSLRPSNSYLTSSLCNKYDSNKNIVTISTNMMMEGMGIRYRPEVSVGTALHQSIYDLTSSDIIGSYWNSSILPTKELSLLASVSNSTRSYPHLNDISHQLSNSLSRKYSGYMTRDVMAHIVPEREDCLEAYEHSMDLRDLYEPPMGSGLVQDTEGHYFDEEEENSD